MGQARELPIKTVLISGANGGLGKELVKLFVINGFRVIGVDLVDPVVQPCNATDRDLFIFYQLDVTRPEQISTMIEATKLMDTGLDLLVSAAGIYDSFPLTEAPPHKLQSMIEVNTMGTVNLVHGLLEPLIKQQGRVIVISSESYKIQALFQPYMVTKASLEAYCIAARQELSLRGVGLTVVRPGAIDTPLLSWMNSPDPLKQYRIFRKELLKSWSRSRSMVGRISSPASVAKKIYKVSRSKRCRRVYHINNNFVLFIAAFIPGAILDRIVRKALR